MEIKAIEHVDECCGINPICPYCDYEAEYDLADGLPEREIFECPSCMKNYLLNGYVAVDYHSTPVENEYLELKEQQEQGKLVNDSMLKECKEASFYNQKLESEV